MIHSSELGENPSLFFEQLKRGVPDINIGYTLSETIAFLATTEDVIVYTATQPHAMAIIWKDLSSAIKVGEKQSQSNAIYVTLQRPLARIRGGNAHELAPKEYLAVIEENPRQVTVRTKLPMEQARKLINNSLGVIPPTWILTPYRSPESASPSSFTY